MMPLDARGIPMLPCTCDVGMCTHRPNCRQQRPYTGRPIDNQNPRYLKRWTDYDARGLLTWEGHRRQQYGPGELNMTRTSSNNEPQRSKADRIARLRQRLGRDDIREPTAMASIIKGILDLLADEL